MRYLLVTMVAMVGLAGCKAAMNPVQVRLHHDSQMIEVDELVRTADAYLIRQGVWEKAEWDAQRKRWKDNYTSVRVDFFSEDPDKLATVSFYRESKDGVRVRIDKRGQATGHEKFTY